MRQAFLDEGIGQVRAGVLLDGRPERLVVDRPGDTPAARLGERRVARVAKLDRNLATAFLDLGAEGAAVLALKPDAPRFAEGASLEIEIRAEGRRGKAPAARLIGLAEGAPRPLAPGPTLAELLARWAPGAPLLTGAEARAGADLAEAEALETVHPLPGGGSVSIEPTRAFAAIDIDVGATPGGESKRVTRRANLEGLAEAARLLRLKGLAGLVVIDLAGRGHDGAALLSAARQAFAPDNPGVAIAPLSRFGVLEAAVPRRLTPTLERLAGPDGAPTLQTRALAFVRDLAREAVAAPGARLTARAAPLFCAAVDAYLPLLAARYGARFALEPRPDWPADRQEIAFP